MAMHATTVRFGDDLWALLESEAAAQGTSVAQFVRDAALMRVASAMARRGEEVGEEGLERLAPGALNRRSLRGRCAARRVLGDEVTRSAG